jgi:hypothetical protein
MIKEVGNFSQFWKSSKRNREASREQKIIFKINYIYIHLHFDRGKVLEFCQIRRYCFLNLVVGRKLLWYFQLKILRYL